MSRTLIMRAGALVAAGFLIASAITNYLFGASLGRSSFEAMLYGFIGVLAVAMNALAPFYISWALAAARKTTAAGIALLWAICVIHSTTSALGFAAQNRESVSLSRQLSRDAYDDTRRELLELEARRKSAHPKEYASLDLKLDDVRKQLAALRGNRTAPADAQSTFLASLFFGLLEPSQVRAALVTLFALMIELGATLGLFAALSHASESRATAGRWQPRVA